MFISFSDFILNESKVTDKDYQQWIKNYFEYFDKELLSYLNEHYNTSVDYSIWGTIFHESGDADFDLDFRHYKETIIHDKITINNTLRLISYFKFNTGEILTVWQDIDISHINLSISIEYRKPVKPLIHLINNERYHTRELGNIEKFYDKIWTIISQQKIVRE
jgi:hypothetical protein